MDAFDDDLPSHSYDHEDYWTDDTWWSWNDDWQETLYETDWDDSGWDASPWHHDEIEEDDSAAYKGSKGKSKGKGTCPTGTQCTGCGSTWHDTAICPSKNKSEDSGTHYEDGEEYGEQDWHSEEYWGKPKGKGKGKRSFSKGKGKGGKSKGKTLWSPKISLLRLGKQLLHKRSTDPKKNPQIQKTLSTHNSFEKGFPQKNWSQKILDP